SAFSVCNGFLTIMSDYSIAYYFYFVNKKGGGGIPPRLIEVGVSCRKLDEKIRFISYYLYCGMLFGFMQQRKYIR
ncbi:MAG: hypothetical protein K2J26_07295, partial [Ruminococcus sp.]|nr:hypothetical protein [Ruminococcus sp.]